MTIGTAQMKAQAAAVTEVQTLMHKHGLTLADLLAIGGRELKSPNPKTCEKARRVEKAWELMARLSVNFAHLENSRSDRSRAAREAARRRDPPSLRRFSGVIGNLARRVPQS